MADDWAVSMPYVPGAQGTQASLELAPISLLYVPRLQSRQRSPVPSPYVPGEHNTHASSEIAPENLLDVPSWQFVHNGCAISGP